MHIIVLVVEYANALEDKIEEAKLNGENSTDTGGWPVTTGIGIFHSAR